MTVEKKLIYHDRYVAFSDGNIMSRITGRVLSAGKQTRGYMTVSLYDGSSPKKAKSFLVHRLIAGAFLGEHPEKKKINHKNGDKTDNRLENLEWVTNQENINHARTVLGKDGYGLKNSQCKIHPDVVEQIRKSDKTAVALAKELSLSVDYIRQIRRGEYRTKG